MLKPLSSEEVKLLQLLEEDSNQSNDILADKVGISVDSLKQLKQNLEDEKIILKYKALVNWEKIESGEVNALIQVSVAPKEAHGYDEVAGKIASFAEVSTCLLVSGSFDLLVEVSGKSLKDVAFFVADKLASIPGVTHTKTNFLLKRYKLGGDLVMVANKTRRLSVVM